MDEEFRDCVIRVEELAFLLFCYLRITSKRYLIVSNMALLETIHLSHLPHDTPAHIALYRDIKNASLLREQLISGNVDFQYAFIDASVVSLVFLTTSMSASRKWTL